MAKLKKRKTTGQITLSDVAKLAGVGTMTVSRALRTPEQVSDKLKNKINKAVKTLGYRPNLAASTLASAANNNIIAIIMPNSYDHQLLLLTSEMQHCLIAQGYTPFIVESIPPKNSTHLQALISTYNVSAIVLINMDKNSLDWQVVAHQHVPIIHIGSNALSYVDINVGLNNMEAMYQLTEYVIEKGYHEIGLLCANHEYSIFQQRLHGWHKAMLKHHLPTHRVINASSPANFSTGSRALADFIINWPELDAIICTTDELACGVLYECQRRHIRVPYQLAIAGFGDSEFSQVSHPPLTTVSLPYKSIGEYAAILLLQRLSDNHQFNLPTVEIPNIRIRGSL